MKLTDKCGKGPTLEIKWYNIRAFLKFMVFKHQCPVELHRTRASHLMSPRKIKGERSRLCQTVPCGKSVCPQPAVTPLLEEVTCCQLKTNRSSWRSRGIILYKQSKSKHVSLNIRITPSPARDLALKKRCELAVPGSFRWTLVWVDSSASILWVKGYCHRISCYFPDRFTDLIITQMCLYITLPGIIWTFID